MKPFRSLLITTLAITAGMAAQAQSPAIRWMKPGAAEFTRIVFSPDGNTIAHTCTDGVQFVHTGTGESRAIFSPGSDQVAFSPDGSRIFCTFPLNNLTSRAYLLDAATFRVVDTVRIHVTRGIGLVAFTRDGSGLVIRSNDARLLLWDLKMGKVRSELTGMGAGGFALSPKEDLMAALFGSHIQIYDTRNGDRLGSTSLPHEGVPFTLRFSPDGEHVLIGTINQKNETSLIVWDHRERKTVRQIPLPSRGPLARVTEEPRLVVTRDGRFAALSTGSDSSLLFVDVETGAPGTGLYFNTPVYRAEFSPDGRYLAIAGPGLHIHLLDAATWSYLRDLPLGGVARGDWLAASPDGRLVASAATEVDDRVRVWDVATGAPVRTFIHSPLVSGPPSFTPDGTGLMLPVECDDDDYTAEIRSLESGNSLGTLVCDAGRNWQRMVALHPDGRHQLVMRKDEWRLIDVMTQVVKSSGAHPQITGAALSRDGRHICTSGDNGRLRVFDAATGELLNDIQAGGSGYVNMAITVNGDYVIASQEERDMHLWGIRTNEYRVLEGSGFGMSGVACSPDGRLVFGTSYDGNIYIWRISDGLRLYTYSAPWLDGDGGWTDIVIAPDFSSFTTIGGYGAVVNWSTEPLKAMSVPSSPAMAPGSIHLAAYPNPAAAATEIRLHLAHPAHGALRVYDALGRTAATLAEGAFEAGDHTYMLDSGLPPGHYIVGIQVEGGTVVCPLVRVE